MEQTSGRSREAKKENMDDAIKQERTARLDPGLGTICDAVEPNLAGGGSGIERGR